MSVLENLTPFAATCIPSMSREDRSLALVIVAGRFYLPAPGIRGVEAPTLADDQGEVRLADEYDGDLASPLLLREGQSTYTRPGTDLYLHGHAWTPRGRPLSRSQVELRVGPRGKRAVVFGERTWTRGVTGVTPGSAQTFESIPLTYRRCFGGSPARPARDLAEAAEYNPVGCGLHNSSSDAIGSPLPNFEDPDALLRGPGDRPRPCGFGPIARHWRPRRDFAGSYDRTWTERRVPLWPEDVNEHFFAAAAPGLLAVPHLEGGEPVRIAGMSPDGEFAFSLPRVHLQARFDLGAGSVRRRLALDAIEFDLDARSLTMYWRAHILADPLKIGATVLRVLAPWEVPE